MKLILATLVFLSGFLPLGAQEFSNHLRVEPAQLVVFQEALASQISRFESIPAEDALNRLQAGLSKDISGSIDAATPQRIAAESLYLLLVSPETSNLAENSDVWRELAAKLGEKNIKSIKAQSAHLRQNARLEGVLNRLHGEFPTSDESDIGLVQARLDEMFTGSVRRSNETSDVSGRLETTLRSNALAANDPVTADKDHASNVPAPAKAEPEPLPQGREWLRLLTHPREYSWHIWTKFLTLASSFAFLYLQLPQLIKNIGYLAGGSLEPIKILPWIGFGTNILADLLILSWFLSQKNVGPSRVQAVGVVAASSVLATIWYAGYMPAAAFFPIVGSALFGVGFAYANYKGLVSERVWKPWSGFINAVGLIVVPFAAAGLFGFPIKWVLGSVGSIAGVALALKAAGRLPAWAAEFWKNIGAWTATFLFMVYPVAQILKLFAEPLNIAGLSLLSIAAGTLGNLMMLGEATESKNQIWTVGSSWSVIVGGLGIGWTAVHFGAVSPTAMAGATALIGLTLGFYAMKNAAAHGESIWGSLKFLLGKRLSLFLDSLHR